MCLHQVSAAICQRIFTEDAKRYNCRNFSGSRKLHASCFSPQAVRCAQAAVAVLGTVVVGLLAAPTPAAVVAVARREGGLGAAPLFAALPRCTSCPPSCTTSPRPDY